MCNLMFIAEYRHVFSVPLDRQTYAAKSLLVHCSLLFDLQSQIIKTLKCLKLISSLFCLFSESFSEHSQFKLVQTVKLG